MRTASFTGNILATCSDLTSCNLHCIRSRGGYRTAITGMMGISFLHSWLRHFMRSFKVIMRSLWGVGGGVGGGGGRLFGFVVYILVNIVLRVPQVASFHLDLKMCHIPHQGSYLYQRHFLPAITDFKAGRKRTLTLQVWRALHRCNE